MKFNADAELQDDDRRASQAVQHVAGAHHLLRVLRDRFGVLEKHPELGKCCSSSVLDVCAAVVRLNASAKANVNPANV